MKNIFFVLILLFAGFLISCSEVNSPADNETTQLPEIGCYIAGIELDFADTCSYQFITNFIIQFDSVTVIDSYLGSTFWLYADSGNYDYWLDYFANDQTIDRIDSYRPVPDSLVLVIKLTGQKSVAEETDRFSQIEHLTILNVDIHNKTLLLDVAENTEESWKLLFEQYPFISYVNIIMVCVVE